VYLDELVHICCVLSIDVDFDILVVSNIALLSVRAGSIYNEAADYDAKQLQVDKSFVHPDYGLVAARNVFLNDVAILHLSSPITFTDTIKPICLPSPSVNLQQFKVCVATGFGNTRSDAGKPILSLTK